MGAEGALLGAAGGGDAVGAVTNVVSSAAMAFQLGLAPMVAIAAGLTIATKLNEAREEAKKLNAEIDKMGMPMAGGASASIEDINAKLKEVEQTAAHFDEVHNSFFHGLANYFNPYSGGTEAEQGKEGADKKRIDDERSRLTGRLADREGRDNTLNRRGFENGEDTVAIDRIREKFAREREEITERAARGEISSTTELEKASRDAESNALAAEQRKQRSAAAAVALESQIVAIKREGLSVDVAIAEARLQAAQAALQNGPKGGTGQAELQKAVDAATFEVEQAKKATAEKAAQAELETRIASLRGSSDQVRKATLDAQGQDAQRRLDATKPDDRPAIQAEQARLTQQQDEFEKQKNLRAINTAGKEDKANAGRDFSSQLALLQKELDRDGDRQTWNNTENGGDPDFKADLDLHTTELKNAIVDLTNTEKSRLTALQNDDSNTKKRGYQPTLGMKDASTDEKFDAQITKEKEGKNDPAVVAQLEQNRKDEHFENAVDEQAMTPEEKKARNEKNNRRDQARGQVQSLQDRKAQNIADNNPGLAFQKRFHPIHSTSEIPSEIRRPYDLPSLADLLQPRPITVPNRVNDIKAGAEAAGKGDAMTHVDNAGIIGGLGKVEAAVKQITMKRRP